MAYIQGFGQQWQTDPSGALQNYAAPTSTAAQATPPAGSQYVATGYDPSGNPVPDYTNGMAGGAGMNTMPSQGSAGGAGMPGSVPNTSPNTPQAPAQTPAQPPNFGGLAATPGGSMTWNGQQYIANNGQWSPVTGPTGMQNPMASGPAPWSQIPGVNLGGFQGQAGGQDMLGAYTLNNRNFTSLEDANMLAKLLGANVVSTNYEDGSRTPEYNLDFGRGSPLNAGQLAYYFGPNSSFAGIRDPNDRLAAIKRSIEDELRYNDSGMERQVADKRDQFSSFKNTPGGYQSGVATGSGAPSLSDNSFWQNTSPLPWQAAAGPLSQPGFANGLPGAPGTGGEGTNPYQGTGGPQNPPPAAGGGSDRRLNPYAALFNMSPNMNTLYYGNQRPNGQYGGYGMIGTNGLFTPQGMGGFGGFGGQMPFTMGAMPGFMGQQNMFAGMQNPLSQLGGGFGGLIQLISQVLGTNGIGTNNYQIPAGSRPPSFAGGVMGATDWQNDPYAAYYRNLGY